jgi:glycyl-radical enzyme activating protein family
MERNAFVFNVQKYNMYDGPGVRTIVFFKGCPLRCKWCSNPESVKTIYQVLYKRDACINCGACINACPTGIHVMKNRIHEVKRNNSCMGCRKCTISCPKNALEIAGEMKTLSEILEIVKEDTMFYEMSGGGVTLGGGECTMQPESAKALLMACKQEGINTAIETCGYVKTDKFLEIAEYVDYFLFDIKHMNPERHTELTGVSNDLILHNLTEILKYRHNVTIRMPILKGINSSKEEIQQVITFLLPYKGYANFKGIDLLPYHKLGVNKYKQLDLEYPLKGELGLSDQELEQIEEWIKDYDFPVRIVRH